MVDPNSQSGLTGVALSVAKLSHSAMWLASRPCCTSTSTCWDATILPYPRALPPGNCARYATRRAWRNSSLNCPNGNFCSYSRMIAWPQGEGQPDKEAGTSSYSKCGTLLALTLRARNGAPLPVLPEDCTVWRELTGRRARSIPHLYEKSCGKT